VGNTGLMVNMGLCLLVFQNSDVAFCQLFNKNKIALGTENFPPWQSYVDTSGSKLPSQGVADQIGLQL